MTWQSYAAHEIQIQKGKVYMSVKIIALDLDGKALNVKNEITGSTEKTLTEAARLGIEIVPVTGRCYRSIPEELLECASGDGIRYAVTSNGAEIRDMKKGGVLYGDYLKPETAAKIKSVLYKQDIMIEVYVNGKAYIEKKYFNKIMAGEIAYRDRDFIMKTRVPVRGTLQLLDVHSSRIEKVSVYFNGEAAGNRVREMLDPVDHVSMFSSSEHRIDLVAENCSKHRTLDVLCRRLDVKPLERLSVGREKNDFDKLYFLDH